MTFDLTLDLTFDLTSILLILLLFSLHVSSSQQVVSERSWSGSGRFFKDWSSWGVWSVCSCTCGGGASVRTRTCVTRNPVGGPCSGEPRQYKICNTEPCPHSSEDFRELQCQAFNQRPLVSGSSFTWTSFSLVSPGSNPCELTCLAVGHRFYYNFGRVLDGTSCGTDSGSVCVNGHCLKAGCDQVLGSDLIEDICMICGGHNQTCLHHQDQYRPTGEQMFGYNKVAMIPAGATHVRVTDNSRNYLVLQSVRAEFLINGDWTISRPGEYLVAGTKLLYKRLADVWESFELNGPTQEDLHLMVLSTEPNPRIEYEYWLPPEQYFLYHGPKSPLRHALRTATVTMATPAAVTTPTAARPQRVLKPPRQTSPRLQPQLEPEQNQRNLLPPPQKNCGKCARVRGRRERQKQYCSQDFVFRAEILQKRFLGSETRYDVQIVQTYRNRFRLEHREFVWAADQCDCPLLEPGRQYVLMVRRHINHERTLNRILLEPGSYTSPYRPREDALLLPLLRLCDNRGVRQQE